MRKKEITSLKQSLDFLKKKNKGNYYLDYVLGEGWASEEWYRAILREVKKYKPNRVIDIGSGSNIFGYLFAREGIEYIGIDDDKILRPIEGKNIEFIHSNYYDIREEFKDDIIISCLCVDYLIPIEDVLGRRLIINDSEGTGKNYKCTARDIDLEELRIKIDLQRADEEEEI